MLYWKTYNKNIILRYLQSAVEHKLSFTIWQQFGEHRNTFQGQFLEASQKNCKIKLENDHTLDLFDDKNPIFIHITQLNIIFKKEHFNKLGLFVEFYLPGDIQISEKRKTKRYTYLYQDHKSITFHSKHNGADGKTPMFTHSSVLVDISTQGAGLVVNETVLNDLFIDQELLLIDLTDQKLPAPFKVRITYIEAYEKFNENLHKIGIIFTDELNTISYKSISSIIDIKQRKMQGLSSDEYCGVDTEEQNQILNKIEGSNKILANNIRDNVDFLDQLRYLTTQMKIEFLKEVNHDLLAVALRLSSKELIYELFSEMTDNIISEFLEKLQNERPASGVCKAQDQIIKIIRDKEKKGEIVIDPKAFVTYV
ncbi:MAG: hypothetical protein HON90_13795 [Halobacteriovoraceae bacterium]|jgi:hypothetical protein|nr:hypothetical protein [Halobacteriovoraceae bacterium]